MSAVRVSVLALSLSFAGMAGNHEPVGATSNGVVEIKAQAIIDPAAIRSLLGSDLGGNYIVVSVQVAPVNGKPITVNRDDFVLKTDRDGDHAQPFAPTQIAGQGALVVHEVRSGAAGPMGEQGGPIYGGVPGTTMGPQRLPGDGGYGGLGGGGGSAAKATMDHGKEKRDPVLDTLTAKALPEKTTSEPISGLLYFPLEKQRLKDLELTYSSTAGKLKLRFR